jgi:hypothetical protein
MSENGKVDLIYDIVKTHQEENKQFREEVKQSTKETLERLTNIEKLDEIQNAQLAEHMKRSDMLELLHKDNESRIRVLEAPIDVFLSIKDWVVLGGKMAGAITAIYLLLKLIGLI